MKSFNNYFIDSFLFEKEINEGLSSATIFTYEVVLKFLINGEFVNIDDSSTFTEINFKKLLSDLQLKNNWSSWTYNRYRKNYKVFCDYLIREKFICFNPLIEIKQRKIEKILPKIYTKEQVSMITYTLNRLLNGDDYKSIRDRSIIYTYLYTGLRLTELMNLVCSDVNLEEDYILVRHGKGGKDRYIPIIDKLGKILKTYFCYREKNGLDSNYFFSTIYGNKVNRILIYKVINKLRDKLQFPITCHRFRHTFATELAKNDVNIFNIAQILGHSKIETTKIYLNYNVENIKSNLDKLQLFK